jgi:hypothetical protein
MFIRKTVLFPSGNVYDTREMSQNARIDVHECDLDLFLAYTVYTFVGLRVYGVGALSQHVNIPFL